MNKKILMLTIMLVAMLTLSIIPVQAGKGQQKLNIEFTLGAGLLPGAVERMWWSALKEEFPPPPFGPGTGEPILHIRGQEWYLDAAGFVIVLYEDDGSTVKETFGDDDITYTCKYNMDWNFKANRATIKVRETWEITVDEVYIGYIEILAVESLYNLIPGPDTDPYYGEGTFVGHGVINEQKIKLSGEAGAEDFIPFRKGTVMGWPTT